MVKPFSNLNDTAVNELLSTPQARDSKGAPKDDFNNNCLPRDIIECDQAWGKYEPAVRRWEALTRPAPKPTEPGVSGLKRPRLNPAFSEWMMGWPEGWCTAPEIGITRKDQLKIVGNGVVPQQAAAALRYLMAVATGSGIRTATAAPVELLPTPCVVDRLATTDMTLEQWDESRRSQKERGVGSFGPRGDSLGAAVLRVEEGTVDQRPDYSSTRRRGQ
jgi:hypothetical protein